MVYYNKPVSVQRALRPQAHFTGVLIYLRRERQFCLFMDKVSYDLKADRHEGASRFFRSLQFPAGTVRNSVYFNQTTVIDVIGHQ